ncbi:hypothetical protein MASR2M36_36350 [Providencia sp.]
MDIPVISVATESNHLFTLNVKSNIGEAVNFLTHYMLQKGHKKIGYIGAQMDSKMQSQQLSGWNKAMLSYNQIADQSITTPYIATMDFGQ